MLKRISNLRFDKALRLLPIFIISVAATAQIQFDKPKSEKPLPNPLIVNVSRDESLTVIKQMLETREIPVDKEDCNQTTGECTLVSKPVIFIKGIQTRSQLEHYAEVPVAVVRNWSRGRYTLRIQVAPASPKTAQIGIYARFEGMADGVVGAEWVSLTSKGELEDRLLRCIQERILGGDCKDEIK
ncbi:MAG TPA: hypothetical protein VFQ92_14330 [Blastocatellia bacterium]|nr:hypothetical protein [Blastocatellia bacterium]